MECALRPPQPIPQRTGPAAIPRPPAATPSPGLGDYHWARRWRPARGWRPTDRPGPGPGWRDAPSLRPSPVRRSFPLAPGPARRSPLPRRPLPLTSPDLSAWLPGVQAADSPRRIQGTPWPGASGGRRVFTVRPLRAGDRYNWPAPRMATAPIGPLPARRPLPLARPPLPPPPLVRSITRQPLPMAKRQ